MIRSIPACLVAIVVLSPEAGAQQRPDFSGVWALDTTRSEDHVYGQIRVIAQTPAQIEMAVLHFASGLPRAESKGQTSIVPWELPFDRWGPRRGGDRSLEPVVQSRWDGNHLVTVKAPGTHYSVLWVWSLADEGMTMTVDVISTRIAPSFDFKVASAPRGFIPVRHVYTRVATPEDRTFALGDAVIRFGRNTGAIDVTCATGSCTVTDVVAGRRGQSRALPNGREASLSLHANTLIAGARE